MRLYLDTLLCFDNAVFLGAYQSLEHSTAEPGTFAVV